MAIVLWLRLRGPSRDTKRRSRALPARTSDARMAAHERARPPHRDRPRAGGSLGCRGRRRLRRSGVRRGLGFPRLLRGGAQPIGDTLDAPGSRGARKLLEEQGYDPCRAHPGRGRRSAKGALFLSWEESAHRGACSYRGLRRDCCSGCRVAIFPELKATVAPEAVREATVA